MKQQLTVSGIEAGRVSKLEGMKFIAKLAKEKVITIKEMNWEIDSWIDRHPAEKLTW
ncbi:hypothetical protein KAU11_12385 [Candidatus Babeliales bacterium]|nr:hypothetical protein [Candidatus Babeliales bacterium]